MTDNVAVLDGYPKHVVATAADYELYLLVKSDVDLDSRFKAWDSDNQEYVWINGWLWSFEDVTQ